jgi:RNA polymerase sigma-70 factor (ECF subfamily)
VVATEPRDRLLDTVARLSRDDRTAINIRCFLELEAKEIAQILGCPGGTVRSRVYRALRQLKRIIEESYPDLSAEVVQAVTGGVRGEE